MSLLVNGVSHRYGIRQALTDVTLDISDGPVGLLGVNGAGKTTLLSICSGALPPTHGSVSIDCSDLYRARQRGSALCHVALMPQHLRVPPHLTAFEAVSYLTWMRGFRWQEATRRADAALKDVGLADRATSKVRQLSGGMHRRIALAQALASGAEVLLLDEPTTGLDPAQRRVVLDLIRSLPHTLFMSSHIVEDLSDTCKRIIVLHEGAVRFDGPPSGLRKLAPNPKATRALEEGFVSLIGSKATP